MWIPLAMQAAVLPGRDWLNDEPGSVEKVMWLHLFGRLAPGVTRERAQANVNVTFQQGLAAYYGSIGDADTRTRYLNQRLKVQDAATGASVLRRTFSEPLWVLLGAAGLVLPCLRESRQSAGAAPRREAAKWRTARARAGAVA